MPEFMSFDSEIMAILVNLSRVETRDTHELLITLEDDLKNSTTYEVDIIVEPFMKTLEPVDQENSTNTKNPEETNSSPSLLADFRQRGDNLPSNLPKLPEISDVDYETFKQGRAVAFEMDGHLELDFKDALQISLDDLQEN
mmetsp:Transcript_10869/g.16502  ORF Transcript_10869/g.16502 Transcript_10869/m.16502 type:complete len:141 (+) Transcript_10869:97-519(+)|eukprot:CAMPEP_0170510538 /NCGR_PEP_ID=MMETSP0208-20121228/65820_1 /TAXON_ID=197538 /ORGANISM="Strombidium inclinatum, Strain S3" /LENGTH=140 /DNA_ID=CAMNT_0010794009 /DNA_START=399 /DNA_END=821 /DNA_ORIENTATION=+